MFENGLVLLCTQVDPENVLCTCLNLGLVKHIEHALGVLLELLDLHLREVDLVTVPDSGGFGSGAFGGLVGKDGGFRLLLRGFETVIEEKDFVICAQILFSEFDFGF